MGFDVFLCLLRVFPFATEIWLYYHSSRRVIDAVRSGDAGAVCQLARAPRKHTWLVCLILDFVLWIFRAISKSDLFYRGFPQQPCWLFEQRMQRRQGQDHQGRNPLRHLGRDRELSKLVLAPLVSFPYDLSPTQLIN